MHSIFRSLSTRPSSAFGVVLVCALCAGTAQATYIAETESNDSFATAQNLDGAFSLDSDSDIGDLSGADTSTTIAHASVRATGDDSLDIYSFTVAAANTRVILDIDYGAPNFDSALWLFHDTGVVNEIRNDYDTTAVAGAAGSVANLMNGNSDDSFIEQVVVAAGLYYVLVGEQATGSPGYAAVPDDASYTLHVSVDQAISVPVPAALPLFAAGLLGLTWARRRRV
ncbi:MAG TPA: VPLPA-CTERM sorting domain-containing protein [Gammaproteobacteria bacterium]|nr:VPLPA-CTERM sorting domain-containing protein [Gammaproteobacteria bacterium]